MPGTSADALLAFGEYMLDGPDEQLCGPHGAVPIGHKAWCVLQLLVNLRGRLATKDMLFETVWKDTIVSESALTSVIKELRRALGDDARNPRFIETVYGRGYRFLAEVRIAAAADESEDHHPGLPDAAASTGGEQPMFMFDPVSFGSAFASALRRRALSYREAAPEIGLPHYTLHRVAQGKSPDVEAYLRIQRWSLKRTMLVYAHR